MTLIELIRAELVKQGLPEALAEKITAESEADVVGAVTTFKATYKPDVPKSLAEFLKENGLEDEFNNSVSKMVQSESDKRVTQALETFEKKMAEKGTPPKSDDPVVTELLKKMTELQESVSGQKEVAEQQRLGGLAKDALSKAGLPVTWLGRVQVKAEDEIGTAVAELTKEYDGIKQGVIDQALKDSQIPGTPFASKVGTVGTKEIDEFVKATATEAETMKVEKID